MDLALNNLQRLICHKTNKPNQTTHTQTEQNLTHTITTININTETFLKYIYDTFDPERRKREKKKKSIIGYTLNTYQYSLTNIQLKEDEREKKNQQPVQKENR